MGWSITNSSRITNPLSNCLLTQAHLFDQLDRVNHLSSRSILDLRPAGDSGSCDGDAFSGSTDRREERQLAYFHRKIVVFCLVTKCTRHPAAACLDGGCIWL